MRAEKTATWLGRPKGSWRGDAGLYRLSEPMQAGWAEDAGMTEYVVVSAAIALFTGAETYIFASDAEGNITDWVELEGSFRGRLDHAEALQRAGYVIKNEEDNDAES